MIDSKLIRLLKLMKKKEFIEFGKIHKFSILQHETKNVSSYMIY